MERVGPEAVSLAIIETAISRPTDLWKVQTRYGILSGDSAECNKAIVFIIGIDIGEIPVGAHLLLFLVSYLESLLISVPLGLYLGRGFVPGSRDLTRRIGKQDNDTIL